MSHCEHIKSRKEIIKAKPQPICKENIDKNGCKWAWEKSWEIKVQAQSHSCHILKSWSGKKKNKKKPLLLSLLTSYKLKQRLSRLVILLRLL